VETASVATGHLLACVFNDFTYEDALLLKMTGLHHEAPLSDC